MWLTNSIYQGGFLFFFYFPSVLIILNWQLLTGAPVCTQTHLPVRGSSEHCCMINKLISTFHIWIAIPQVAAQDKIALVLVIFLSPSSCFFLSLSFPTLHPLAPLLFSLLFGTSAMMFSTHTKHWALKIHESSWSQTRVYVNVPLNLCLQVVH